MKVKLYLLPLLLFMVTNLQASMWQRLKERVVCMAQRIASKNPQTTVWCKPLIKTSIPTTQANSNSANNAGIQLDPFAYTIAAQPLLNTYRRLDEESAQGYRDYLQNKSTLLKSGNLNIEEESEKLERIKLAPLFCFNISRFRPLAGAFVDFSETNDRLLAHEVRRKLGCYTTSCDLAEWSYWKEMTKVSEAEYSKRLNTLTKQELMRMQIQNASTLAKTVLSKIDNK